MAKQNWYVKDVVFAPNAPNATLTPVTAMPTLESLRGDRQQVRIFSVQGVETFTHGLTVFFAVLLESPSVPIMPITQFQPGTVDITQRRGHDECMWLHMESIGTGQSTVGIAPSFIRRQATEHPRGWAKPEHFGEPGYMRYLEGRARKEYFVIWHLALPSETGSIGNPVDFQRYTNMQGIRVLCFDAGRS